MEINRTTYEEFFLLYADGELSAGERKAVEDFAELHPDLKQELEMLKMSVLTPDPEIIFERKEELYKEEERKVIAFGWWKMIAAAILLVGFATFGWLYLTSGPSKKTVVAGIDKNAPRNSPATVTHELPKENDARDAKEQGAEEKITGAAVARKAKEAITPVNNKIIERTNSAGPDKIIPADVTNTRREMPDNDVELAIIDEPKEMIDVSVTARTLNENTEEPSIDVSYAAHEIIDQSADNEMIYFANTSVPKRNKLRGVFRKATRIIDKVTSLQ